MHRSITITHARIWPAVDAPVIERGYVVLREGRIEEVGEGLPDRIEGESIDVQGSLVLPGFTQTHVHCCQTLFRGLGEDLPLLPWLRTRIWPLEAAHTPATLRISAQLTCAEMIRGGTTAFLSMETVHGTEEVCEAVEASGMRAVIGHCLMDDTGGYPALAVDPEDSLDTCEQLLETWGEHDRVRVAVAPRFALSCSESAMREACIYARSRGLLLHTHASEQREEVDAVRAQTGRLNIHYLHDVGLTGPDVALAHCVHTEPSERDILADTGTRVLHCPSANLKLGSGTAPIPEYLEAGISVSLGADGAPCNNRLDMFTEMRTAALLQSPRLGPGALPARDVLRMALEEGPRVLGWGEELGRLEPGARASLIAVRTDGPHQLPDDDPASSLVYCAQAGDVHLTIVDGRILYHDGVFPTLDMERLRADTRQARRTLERQIGL